MGARRALIVLREPASRIFSGLQRRAESHDLSKPANREFLKHFQGGKGTANAFIDALRDRSHPSHAAAMNVAIGPRKQNYLLPVSEYYLDGTHGLAAIEFMCLHNLSTALDSALVAWGLNPPPPKETSRHTSTVKQEPFTPTNQRWIHDIYRADVELYERECVRGRRWRYLR